MNDGRRAPRFDWNEAKRVANIAKHGLDFSILDESGFEWETAFVRASFTSGEPRLKAIGFVDDRLCVLIFIIRRTALRAISLRDAHRKEALEYADHNES